MVGVGALIFRNDSVLLVQRGREPALGKWSLPGGLVEIGESLHDAVRREVWEEVGIRVRVVDLIAALDRVIMDDEGNIEYHYILLDFLCDADTAEQPSPASDAQQSRFVSIGDLSGYRLTRGTEKIIRKAFASLSEHRHSIYNPDL